MRIKDEPRHVRILRALLFAALCCVSAVMLAIDFTNVRVPKSFRIASYLLTAGVLVLVLYKLLPLLIPHVKVIAQRFPRLRDPNERLRLMLWLGFFLSTFYAVFKCVTGWRLGSSFTFGLGIYDAVLAVIRAYMLYEQRKTRPNMKPVGVMMLAMHVALAGLVIQIVWFGQSFHYPGFLIVVFAVHALYKLTAAIIRLVRHRHGAFERVLRRVSLCEALVAMFALQTAIVSQFGDSFVAAIVHPITGGIVCFTVLGISLYVLLSTPTDDDVQQEEKR